MADTCGAKTRSGEPCKKAPMLNGRCRFHGGATPKHNNAAPGSIYSKFYTAEELGFHDDIELGKVDQELRLTRIRLRRALAAEEVSRGLPELDEITQNDGGGVAVPRESRTSKIRDYVGIIDKLTARIESLEKTRMALAAEADAPPDSMTADGLTLGDPDEDGPQNPVR